MRNMKNLFVLLLLCISFGISAQDFEFEYEGIWYQIIDSEAKTCRTRAERSYIGTGNDIGGEIDLPSHPIYNNEEYTLIEIGERSFNHASSTAAYIQSVTIPETVTNIGDWAFAGQEELKSIEIPGSVKSIGERAFINNTKLQSITLNDGLETIGYGAFSRCFDIREIVFPQTIKSFGGFMWQTENDNVLVPTGYHVEKIVCLAPVPPTIDDGKWYYNYYSNGNTEYTTLYVPKGCKDSYLKAQGWEGYGNENIKELDRPMVFLPRSSMELTAGQTVQLTAQMISGGNHNAKDATWSSSDESVVTVKGGTPLINGIITAVGPGTARVTFAVEYSGDLVLEAYCDITVKAGAVGFSLSHSNIELELNETQPLTVNLTGLDLGRSTIIVTVKHEDGTESSDKCEVVVLNKSTSDFSEIFKDDLNTPIDVYSINGVCIMRNVHPDEIKNLSTGLYIVGDKKILIK